MPADDMYIIDRRLNPSGKSLANRQRFLRRAKALGALARTQTALDPLSAMTLRTATSERSIKAERS